MLKPQKDTIYLAIQIAKKQYDIKLALATSLYFFHITHGGRHEDHQEYIKVKNDLMDLKIHIEVLEELVKEAE